MQEALRRFSFVKEVKESDANFFLVRVRQLRSLLDLDKACDPCLLPAHSADDAHNTQK